MNTLPNKITLCRIVLIPVFMLLAYQGFMLAAFLVYIIACLSDMADGYIARKYNQISNFGKFMDPLADKMLVLSAMCFFIESGQMPGWAVAIVLFREFAVSGLRLIAVEQNRVIAAAWSGKIKTAATMIASKTSPDPQAIPIPADTHKVAAVVNPRTDKPVRMIVPAQTKPIPAVMPAPIREVS